MSIRKENKALVTGGAGFIGSHVAEELLKNGYKVTVLDDLSGGFIDNIPSKAEFIKGNICDYQLIEKIFKNDFNYVFHLAAYAAECLSHYIKRYNYINNLIGSVNLINASVNNKVKCFVFTSSAAVYGKDTKPNPEDSYGIAKLAVEQELKISKQMFDLNYIIFRPHNVFGERQNIYDKYRNVIGIFMNQIINGKPMTIYGDGNQKRPFTYIKDVAPVIAKAIENPRAYCNIFNIGSNKLYTINKLAISVALAMGVDAKTVHIPARKEVKIVSPNHNRIKKIFNYKNKYDLESGLSRMSRWVKSQNIRKNIPIPGWGKKLEIPSE